VKNNLNDFLDLPLNIMGGVLTNACILVTDLRIFSKTTHFQVSSRFAWKPVSPVGQWCQQEESNPRPSHYEYIIY